MAIRKPWTPAELATLKRLKDEGKLNSDIAEILGRSQESVNNKVTRWYIDTRNHMPVKDLAAEVERFAKAAGVTPQVTPLVDEADEYDAAIEWQGWETRSSKRLRAAALRNRFEVDLGDEPVIVAAVSDQHIGSNTDYKRMREDAELIRDTPNVFGILVGDGVDNHVKHRAAIIAASMSPDDQFRLYDHYLRLFGDSILVMISGNHDAFTVQVAGVDIVSRLAEAKKICYAPASARLDIALGGVDYAFAIRHQYRFNSNFNMGHTVKRLYDMGEEVFDVGIIGHHHEANMEVFQRHGRDRWAARPGSYQQSSAYSRQYGFNDAVPTCPAFMLFPGKRHIIGFADLRDALLVTRGWKQ